MAETLDAALQALTRDIQGLQSPEKLKYDPALDMLECVQNVTTSYAKKTLFEDVRAWIDDRNSTYFGYILAEFERKLQRMRVYRRVYRALMVARPGSFYPPEDKERLALMQCFVDFMRLKVEAWVDKKD